MISEKVKLSHTYTIKSSRASHLEAHAGFFRLLMTGIFNVTF